MLDFAAETESRFDSLAFAALCTGGTAIPPLDESLRALERAIGPEDRGQIVEYLGRLVDGLDPDAAGPGGPEALARLIRHFEKPPPADAQQPLSRRKLPIGRGNPMPLNNAWNIQRVARWRSRGR